MVSISPKVGGCDIGHLVFDWALGRNGIVIGGPWVDPDGEISWEWQVLYDDGQIAGASTNDLKVIR